LNDENWQKVLNNLGTDALDRTYDDAGEYMVDSDGEVADHATHAHHIVFKQGLGETGKVAADEAQQLLQEEYDIDPFYGRENLVWAPNQGHKDITMVAVRDKLFEVHENIGTEDAMVEALKELGQQYIDQTLPGMKNAP
jgi:A nuclease family of the HNH/ENDO VII superfamily with conserved AHH